MVGRRKPRRWMGVSEEVPATNILCCCMFSGPTSFTRLMVETLTSMFKSEHQKVTSGVNMYGPAINMQLFSGFHAMTIFFHALLVLLEKGSRELIALDVVGAVDIVVGTLDK